MNIGVIFAGGVGSRMNSKDLPKQFLKIFNKPIIVHTIEFFQNNANIDAVVIACHKDYLDHMAALVKEYHLDKVKKIVPGGETGQLSIYAGLCAAEELESEEDTIVLIHDGVRPLINSELLTRNIETVRKYGACITGSIVKETVITTDGNGLVEQVPSRDTSRIAKAPQSFWLKDIIYAHRKAMENNEITHIDSCTLMARFGFRMHIIDGPIENIKITTPDDFFTMRATLEARENEQLYMPGNE